MLADEQNEFEKNHSKWDHILTWLQLVQVKPSQKWDVRPCTNWDTDSSML